MGIVTSDTNDTKDANVPNDDANVDVDDAVDAVDTHNDANDVDATVGAAAGANGTAEADDANNMKNGARDATNDDAKVDVDDAVDAVDTHNDADDADATVGAAVGANENDTNDSERVRSYDEVNDYRIGIPLDQRTPRDLVNVFEFAKVKVWSPGLDNKKEHFVEVEYNVYSNLTDEARVSSIFKSVPLKEKQIESGPTRTSNGAVDGLLSPGGPDRGRNNAYETALPDLNSNSNQEFNSLVSASISHFMDSSHLPLPGNLIFGERVSLKCSLMQKQFGFNRKIATADISDEDVRNFFDKLLNSDLDTNALSSISSKSGLDFVRNEPFSRRKNSLPVYFYPHGLGRNRDTKNPFGIVELDITKERWSSLCADFNPDRTIGLREGRGEGRLPEYYRQLVERFPDFVNNLGIQEASSLPFPVDAPNPNLEENEDDRVKVLDGTLIFPKRDEHVKEGCLEKLLPLLNVLEMSKVDTQFMGDRKSAMYYIRVVVENMLKKQNTECGLVHWADDLCDPVMKRVFFTSLGQHIVERLKEGEEGYPGYIADLMDLKKYKYREGYEPLACKVLFDTDGNITEIEDTDGTKYKPSTNEYVPGYHTVDTSTISYQRMWEWMKQKARSATFAWVSLQHLSTQHYLWGNYGSTSLRLYLPTNHKFRMTFCSHFWRTAFTCKLASPLLYDERGLLSRLINLDYKEGLEQIMKDYIDEFKFSTYPEDLRSRGLHSNDELSECKFHIGVQDGLPLYYIIKKYVSGMVDEIFPTEDSLKSDEDMRKTYEYWKDKFKVPAPTEYKLSNVKMVRTKPILNCSMYM